MKKILKESFVIIAIASLAAGLIWAWPHLQSRFTAQGKMARKLAEPSPVKAVKRTTRGDQQPNRQLPEFRPISEMPEIPEDPTDDHIVQSRIFPDRLWAIGGSGNGDNAALGEFLRKAAGLEERAKYQQLEEWLKRNPDSRWALALRSQLMDFKFKTGWFEAARQGWKEIWDEVKDRQDIPGYHLANDVLGRLLEVTTGTSRVAELRELVDAAQKRPLNGPLEGKVFRAREMVWLLEHTAAQNVMCGPLALNAIKDFKREHYIAPRLSQVPPEFKATGIPLAEVQRLAETEYDLDLAMAQRSGPGTKIPTPAVMHVRDDHFNSLLAVSDDGSQYFLEDRTLNFAGWVDREAVEAASSGYFLIASNQVGSGWNTVDWEEGSRVFGRDGAHGTQPTDEATDDDDPKTDDDTDDNQCRGMPRFTFHPMPGAVRIGDVPLYYSPPVGPSVGFKLNYNDMDSGAPTSPPTWSNVGVTWSTNWVAWIEHVSGSLNNGTTLRVRVPGGGTQVVTYNSTTGQFGPHDQSFATVTRTGTHTYTRSMPDGSKEVYDAPDNPTSPTRVFLTQIIDPYGNALTLSYDANIRLVSVADEIGQVTTLAYNDTNNIYRITDVTDPFGRSCHMTYDVAGRLTGVTDQIGLTSSFTYASNGFIDAMTTPYGTSTFSKPVDSTGSRRIVEVTDPTGGRQRVEFNDTGSTSIPSLQSPVNSVQVGGESVSFYAEDTRLQFRNAWYWDELANEVAPGDYQAAKNYRFYTNRNWQVVPVIEAIKPAGEARIWFNYPGGVDFDGSGFPYYPGVSAAVQKILRMLPDGTPQLRQIETNEMGRIIREVDPLGRTTEYTYDSNGIDLLNIRQTTNGVDENQLSATYNTSHLPTSFTDAAGSTKSFTYNSRGQVLTRENALNEVTTFEYNPNGYLLSVDGPLAGTQDRTTFLYDSVGRVQRITGPDGFTRDFEYDDLDRITKITFPDNTYQEVEFALLDTVKLKDRLGRTTEWEYDALRRISSVLDPMDRRIEMIWCRCGQLNALSDGLGRWTRWVRDLQGKVIRKVYADGSSVSYNYDSIGRLTQKVDEKGQVKDFKYHSDSSLKSVHYSNSEVPTPSVTYTYDQIYRRLTKVEDGAGITRYEYHPVTNNTSPGALKIKTIDGPFEHDEIEFAYDALGRRNSRTVGGVTSTVQFDNAGRISGMNDVVGPHTFAFEGSTNRITSLTLPNGITSHFDYFEKEDDFRLKTISHRRDSDDSTISEFSYTYDSSGRVETWGRSFDSAPEETWNLEYDLADQLTGVQSTVGGIPSGSFSYEYDAAGNRLAYEDESGRVEYTYDALNRIKRGSATGGAYSWDAENRLVRMALKNRLFEFEYDSQNRRRIIRETRSGVVRETRLIWDGIRVVETRSEGEVVRVGSHGIVVTDSSGERRTVFTRDHLGSVREEIDESGNIAGRFRYSPFGKTTIEGASPFGKLGFQGHWYVEPAEIYLAPFRALDPTLGRWISRDPLEEGDGPNLYSFVRNNPVNLVDPTGLKVWNCRKPLDALGGGADDDQRIGPDMWGNPLYHQFYCVEIDGKTECFGQTLDHDQSTTMGQWGSGMPSNDYYTDGRCEEVEGADSCLANCLKEQGGRPRPNYGLFGPGTNCQEWVDDQFSTCQDACKNQSTSSDGPSPMPAPTPTPVP